MAFSHFHLDSIRLMLRLFFHFLSFFFLFPYVLLFVRDPKLYTHQAHHLQGRHGSLRTLVTGLGAGALASDERLLVELGTGHQRRAPRS